MSKVKFFGLLFLALFTFVSVASCKGDDDNATPSIVGKWTFVSEVDNGETDIWVHQCASKKDYMQLNNDGKGQIFEYDSDCTEYHDDYTYSLSGDQLTLINTQHGEPDVYTVKTLTDKKLSIESKYTEDGVTYTYVINLER